MNSNIEDGPWRFLFKWPVIYCAVVIILFCRQPDAIIHPTLYAEDGAILFKQQYEMGFLPALTTQYAGYVLIAPRIIAALCSYLPLEIVPFCYALSSLLIAAGALAFFCSKGFRTVIENDRVRIAVVFLFTIMPNNESLMKLAYLNWYMLFFTVLVTIYTLPEGPIARWSFFILAVVTAWSNPVSIICLPLFFFRAWWAREPSERLWWLLLSFVLLCFPLTAKTETPFHGLVKEPILVLLLVRAITYRVFCFFAFGYMAMRPLVYEAWMIISGLSLIWAGSCIAMAVLVFKRDPKTMNIRRMAKAIFFLALGAPPLLAFYEGWLLTRLDNWACMEGIGILLVLLFAWMATIAVIKSSGSLNNRLAPAVLLYLIVALPDLIVLRKVWLNTFQNWDSFAWKGNDRYFFCSTLLLCVLGGIFYERVYRNWMVMSKNRRQLSLLFFICCLSLHALDIRMAGWQTLTPWSFYAGKIRAAETAVARNGGHQSVHIKNKAEGFDFDLLIMKQAAKPDDPANHQQPIH